MNREKLAQRIFWMRSFTEAELNQTIGEVRGSRPDFDAHRSLRDYLENLKRLGMLGFEKGRYLLRNPAKEQRHVAA